MPPTSVRLAETSQLDWLNTKWATRKGDVNNHIAEHHRLTNHTIDWDSAQCLTYSTNYFQRLTLESWFTNLEQTPLNRCQPLPAPYKRLIHDINITNEPNRTTFQESLEGMEVFFTFTREYNQSSVQEFT